MRVVTWSSEEPSSPITVAPVPALLLDERFADNRHNWPDDPQGMAWLAEGGYRLAARQPGQFVAVDLPGARPLRDVVVSGSFRKVGGPPGGQYGLIVRDQGPGPRDGLNQSGRFYVLAVDDRGSLGAWRREGDRWVDIVPWTPSPTVLTGEAANLLSVQAVGSRLTFLVNGLVLASFTDAALPDGTVGLYVGGDFNEALLDHFAVQVFDSGTPAGAAAPADTGAPGTLGPPGTTGAPSGTATPGTAGTPGSPGAPGSPGPPAYPAPPGRGQQGVVSTGGQGGASLREGPHPQAAVIEALPDGTPVGMLGPEIAANGRTWRQVVSPAGNIGWVDSTLLRPRS